MECNVEWSRDHLCGVFSKDFMLELTKKEAERLWSQQWQLMPETQRQMRDQLATELSNSADSLLRLIEGFFQKHKKFPKEVENTVRNIISKEMQNFTTSTSTAINIEPDEEELKFIKHCPKALCNGFLSKGYKCGLCHIKVCSKCLEVKDDNHECTENNLKSAELIKKDTKSCPKCGVGIYKINGCNDMWCVHCNTRFCWRTLKIMDSSRGVHNPHYFEYIQSLRTNNINNNACGGLNHQNIIHNCNRDEYLLNAYRFINQHHQYYEFSQNTYDTRFDSSMLGYRKEYLRGDLKKEAFIRKAFLLLNSLQKKKHIGDLQNMLYNSVLSVLEGLNSKSNLQTSRKQIQSIRSYYNGELLRVKQQLKSSDTFFKPIKENWLVV
jgi:hypothetical protein